MGKDDQKIIEQPGLYAVPLRRGRALSFQLAALALTVVTLATATGFLMVTWFRPKTDEIAPTQAAKPSATEQLFRGWPAPDVALVLSGQQDGFLQPCGCSDPQFGGVARRYNFLQTLIKDRGWPIVLADLGDVAQEAGASLGFDAGPQKRIKYRYSMQALKMLNYTAVGLGPNEALMPLFDALGEHALNDPKPRVVCANLIDKDGVFFPQMMSRSEISEAKGNAPRVGITAVVGPSMAKDLEKRSGDDLHFDNLEKVLPGEIAALQQKKAELLLLLFLGTDKEVKALAEKFPQFQVILYWSPTEEPPRQTDMVGATLLVQTGWRGRYVGVVGVKRTETAGRHFDFRYELISLGPEFETPQGKDKSNPLHALMERYAQEVHKEDYLGKFPHEASHPLQVQYPEATYVGSEKCKNCHESAYEVWKNHKHSHAYQTLADAKRPALRQFDGECIVCHTTGFGYKSGFTNATATPKLKDVGCENCHGPASLHIKNKNDVKIRQAMNPLKGQGVKGIFSLCFKCHNEENAPKFRTDTFEEYWVKKKTAHPTPKD